MVNEINFKNLKLIFLISKLIKKSFKKDENKIEGIENESMHNNNDFSKRNSEKSC